MPINITLLENILKKSFPDAQLEIKDMVGDSNHYQVMVDGSEKFNDISIIKQHRMVYESLKEYISSGELHAISIKTKTKEKI